MIIKTTENKASGSNESRAGSTTGRWGAYSIGATWYPYLRLLGTHFTILHLLRLSLPYSVCLFRIVWSQKITSLYRFRSPARSRRKVLSLYMSGRTVVVDTNQSSWLFIPNSTRWTVEVVPFEFVGGSPEGRRYQIALTNRYCGSERHIVIYTKPSRIYRTWFLPGLI